MRDLVGGDDDGSVGSALLACHDRIRKFLRTAERLAGAEPATPQDVDAASAALVKYFTEALPRHAQDEDESLRPRLQAAGFDGDLDALEREHREIDAILERLVPEWRAISGDPARRAAARLQPDTDALRAIFEKHLAWEEAHLIPRLEEILGRDALEAVSREMAARRDRGPASGAQS